MKKRFTLKKKEKEKKSDAWREKRSFDLPFWRAHTIDRDEERRTVTEVKRKGRGGRGDAVDKVEEQDGRPSSKVVRGKATDLRVVRLSC